MYIARIEREGGRARGWLFVVPSRHPEMGGRSFLFSDSIYGSSDKALAKAKAMRDELLGQPSATLRYARMNCGNRNDRRNALGLVGVHLEVPRGERASTRYAWVANWVEGRREDGRPHQVRRRFSFNGFHDCEQALAEAVKVREAKSGMHFTAQQLRDALDRVQSTLRAMLEAGMPVTLVDELAAPKH